jgi:hypothetical protein
VPVEEEEEEEEGLRVLEECNSVAITVSEELLF